jgi:putative transposase
MREKRQKVKNGRYHITTRINDRLNALEEKEVKELFLEVVKRAKEKYKFVIYNFCIMDNHVHYMMEPHQDTDLSIIIQWINSVFAKSYNKTYGHTGHVWGARFHSTIIANIEQFVKTFLYIADNPVKANLVLNAADFFYNGIAFILRGDFSILTKPPKYIMDRI